MLGDNPGGAFVQDFSEFQNNGILFIGTDDNTSSKWAWDRELKRRAMIFDGVDDYVLVGNPPSLRIGSGEFALGCWVKTTATSGVGGILSKGLGIMLYFWEGGLWIETGNAATSWSGVNNGEWRHVFAVRASDRLKLYVDGGLVRDIAGNTTNLENGENFTINRRQDRPDLMLACQITDPIVFASDISATEIQQLASRDPMLGGWIEPVRQFYQAAVVTEKGTVKETVKESVTIQRKQMKWTGSRPENFRINPSSPLAQARFAMLGANPGGIYVHDSSQFGNHGTLVVGTGDSAASKWVMENGRRCLAIASSSDYVSRSLALTWPYTIAARVNLTSLSDTKNQIFNNGDTQVYGLWPFNDGRVYTKPNNVIASVPYTCPTNRWVHLAVVRYSALGNHFYADGKYLGSANLASEQPLSVSRIFGGAYGIVGKGADAVAIPGIALTTAQIQQLASPDPMYGGWLEPVRKYYQAAAMNKSATPTKVKIQRKKPKLATRPDNFRINPNLPLARAGFAMLGQSPGSLFVQDSSSFKNDGTLFVGSGDSVSGKWVQDNHGRWGLCLDGSDDYAIANAYSLNNWSAVTIFARIRHYDNSASDQWQRIAEKGGNAEWGLIFQRTVFGICLQVGDTVGARDSGSITTDGDYHAVCGIIKSIGTNLWNTQLWIDGALIDSMDVTKSLGVLTNQLYIGCYGGGDYSWMGDIYDLVIFPFAATPAEIAVLASRDPMYGGWIEPVRKYYQAVTVASQPSRVLLPAKHFRNTAPFTQNEVIGSLNASDGEGGPFTWEIIRQRRKG